MANTTLLGDYVGGHIYDSLPLAVDSPLVIDKPTRDRLVIADPSSAALIRRALAADDIRSWYAEPSRFLIALPRGWTAATVGGVDEATALDRLAGKHPALAKLLRAREDALRTGPHGAFWWELPPYPVDWFGVPLIGWRSDARPFNVAPLLDGTYLLGGITFTTAPTSFLLGVLGSSLMRQAAQGDFGAATAAQSTIPQGSEEAHATIGEFAEQLVEQARQRAALEREMGLRVLRDLAPLGATLGPVLARWWELDFGGFLAELERRFKSDVPFRYRDGWQKLLNEQRRAHFALDAEIVRLEAELNERVERL